MKKTVKLLFLLALCLALVAFTVSCGNDNDDHSKNNHTHIAGEKVVENTVNATCTMDGSYDEVVYCSLCNAEISRNEVTVPMTAHTEDEQLVKKAPTCTEEGTRNIFCKCGNLVRDENISKVPHTYSNDYDANCDVCGYVRELTCNHTNTVVIPGYAATCTANGLTDGKKCAVCGVTIDVQTAIPALEHDKTSCEAKEPTCTEDGWYAYDVCTRCDYSTYTPRSHLGHNYVNGICKRCGDASQHTHSPDLASKENIVEATCTVDGSYDDVIYCATCNKEISRTKITIEALGHNETAILGYAATCTANGLTDGKKCTVCGIVTKAQETIEALDHSFTSKTVTDTYLKLNANCTNAAVYYYKCIRCNEKGSETYTDGDALGHGSTEWFKFSQTHSQICLICNTEITSSEPHDMVNGTCSSCGYEPTISVSNVNAHPGDTEIRVVISVKDNLGILALMLGFTYDESVLTLTKVESGDAMSQLTFTPPGNLSSGNNFIWDGYEISADDVQDGEVLILTFNVSSTAAIGEYNILLEATVYDLELNSTEFKLINGFIFVTN